MTETILEASGLARRFVTHRPMFGEPVEVRAVDGVDLRIARGETFAVVGESGCGKSTLARLLVRLIEPTAGDVLYKGRAIGGLSGRDLRQLRQELQFVFQDPFSSLNPRMTVGALVGEPLWTHDIGTRQDRRGRVAQLLARVGLRPDHADRYPHEFSGGQRQRIGIARALASAPEVLVGDEPVSALDVSIQAQVINLLEDLKDEFGLTLIVISHDLGVVRHMADRVAVMYLGELVEIAPAADLFAAPRHPYTAALLAAIPAPVVGRVRTGAPLGGDLPNPTAPPPGCRFHTRCPFVQDRCRTDRPRLATDESGRKAACHFAGTLPLDGIRLGGGAQSATARRRLAAYAAARDRMDKQAERTMT